MTSVNKLVPPVNSTTGKMSLRDRALAAHRAQEGAAALRERVARLEAAGWLRETLVRTLRVYYDATPDVVLTSGPHIREGREAAACVDGVRFVLRGDDAIGDWWLDLLLPGDQRVTLLMSEHQYDTQPADALAALGALLAEEGAS